MTAENEIHTISSLMNEYRSRQNELSLRLDQIKKEAEQIEKWYTDCLYKLEGHMLVDPSVWVE